MAMAYKHFLSTSLAVVFLFTCSFFFGLATSQDTDDLSGDQPVSAQYYRPYYNNNRRPAYPVRRPAYNYINQRPQIPVTSNYRPSATTVAQPNDIRPSSSTTVSGTCSTNSYQQYGICWTADSQRLQISPNLTIENLVRFYKTNLYSNYIWSPSFFQQFCEQTRRFNSVGVMCVTDDEDNCISNRGTASALRCINDYCICVVGEPYESISQSITSANKPEDCPPGNFACVYQQTQNILSAAGIYWRPPV